MAYVARRTQTNDNLGARVVEELAGDRRSRRIRLDGTLNSRVRDQSIRQNSVGRANGYDGYGYVMDIVSQPPGNARLGQPLRTPVAVRIRRSRSDLPDDDLEDGSLLAVATLLTPGSDGADVPVGTEALAGSRLFDSIHPPDDSEAEHVLGYASFPDLAIRQEGMYRIRITLIKVTGSHGEAMQLVDSRSFVVGRS